MTKLTPREIEVITLADQPNKVIAYKMGISESTVKSMMRNIFTKYGVCNRTQAWTTWQREKTNEPHTEQSGVS